MSDDKQTVTFGAKMVKNSDAQRSNLRKQQQGYQPDLYRHSDSQADVPAERKQQYR